MYNGSSAVTDLTVGESQVSAVDTSGNEIRWWRRADLFPSSVPGNYSSLTSGNNFTCAIHTNGTVSCWGPVASDMQASFSNQSMTTIVAGDSHICGLNSSGFVICGGGNSSGESYAPAGSPYEYVRFALGSSHTCAIKQPNGTAVCWGGPGGASLYFPSNGTSFEFLVAGGNLTCGLATNNYSVLCWGSDYRNPSVRTLPLPKILPGICVAGGDDTCNCGTYPDSGSLCAGNGVICQQCDSRNLVPASPSPALAPAPSGSKVHVGWRVYAIIGTVGTFVGLCAVAYFVWLVCRRKKVHNSVMPTITPAPARANSNTGVATATAHSSSGGNTGRIRFYSRSSSAPRSRKFSRQFSRALQLQRQGSGPSSFKDGADEFPLEILEKATKFFSREMKIGAGSFGTVYQGLLPDGREVAIKRGDSNPRNKRFQEKEDAFQSELAFLSRLNHKHLVSLIGFCVENDERLLVYEYMKNGALHDHLHPKNADFESPVISSWKMRIKILLDASRGIEYLHNYAVPPIIHRDIKSSNILLDANWVARVSDFGLSLTGPNTEEGHLETKAAGTVGYMDPEYYGTNQVTVRSDVYGFGVVMLEVLTGKRAIYKVEGGDGEPLSVVDYAVPRIQVGEVGSIVDSRVVPSSSQEAEALELIAHVAIQCVRLEGRERPTITDVVVNLETALALIGDGQRSVSSTTSASIHSLEERD